MFALLTAAGSWALTGCLTHVTRPVDVVVTHADTGEPAAGVPVEVSYSPLMMDIRVPPGKAAGTTDRDGRLTLPIGDYGAIARLQVGDERQYEGWYLSVKDVRRGGALDYPDSVEPPNKHHVRLVARKRWLVQHLLPPYADWHGTRTEPDPP